MMNKFKVICNLFTVALFLGICLTANAADASYTWQGGDWGGKDFTPGNGDILSGTFTNIGRFVVNAGETIYAGSNLVGINTNETSIYGSFIGGPFSSSSLNISSLTSITLSGSLSQWQNIALSAGQSISFLSGLSISTYPTSGNGGGSSFAAGSLNLSSGSNIYSADPINNIIGSSPITIISNQPVTGGSITLNPVPVPGTLCLLGSGLAGLVGLRRRFTLKHV